MQRKILLLAGLVFLFQVLPAQAGDMIDVKVIKMGSSKAYGEILFIKTDKTKTSFPANGCHTNLSWDYVMPLVSEQDKKLHAMLLAAKASDTLVALSGAGSCDHFSSIESLIGVTW